MMSGVTFIMHLYEGRVDLASYPQNSVKLESLINTDAL